MPLSHMGLPVSHLPSAVSFYSAALQPLGYRYFGQQRDAVGFGIKDADFFISQAAGRYNITPTHIAFSAANKLEVSKCWTAALNAGGRPNGRPGDRAEGCGCFNAAVFDLDGNTVEFIYKEDADHDNEEHAAPERSQLSRSRTWDDGAARSMYSESARSLASKASTTKSRGQTAVELASSASKATSRSAAPPAPSVSRSRTEPIVSDNAGKTLAGTLLGAAAGAAIAYAMVSSERDSAREETEYARSKAGSARSGRSTHEKSSSSGRTSHSERPRERLALEAPMYDYELPHTISRYTSARPQALQRSHTYDAIGYGPISTVSRKDDRQSMKRSVTMPLDALEYYPPSARTSVSGSRHTSARGSVDDINLKRHDSAVSVHSYRSRRSSFDGGRRSSASHVSSIKPSRRSSVYDSAADVPLPSSRAPSYISAADSATTLKPSSRVSKYESAAGVPLPSSRAPSYMSAMGMPLPSSRAQSYVSAKEMSIPPSRAQSYVSAKEVSLPPSRAQSYVSAKEMPLPASRATSYISAAEVQLPRSSVMTDYDPAEESDGLGDTRTIVPDDSISSVGLSTRSRKEKSGSSSSSRSSRHSSKRSEASVSTVRPAKQSGSSRHSAQTLPVRSKDEVYSRSSRDGRRSHYSHA